MAVCQHCVPLVNITLVTKVKELFRCSPMHFLGSICGSMARNPRPDAKNHSCGFKPLGNLPRCAVRMLPDYISYIYEPDIRNMTCL